MLQIGVSWDALQKVTLYVTFAFYKTQVFGLILALKDDTEYVFACRHFNSVDEFLFLTSRRNLREVDILVPQRNCGCLLLLQILKVNYLSVHI